LGIVWRLIKAEFVGSVDVHSGKEAEYSDTSWIIDVAIDGGSSRTSIPTY
jgi:hypothetical protein